MIIIIQISKIKEEIPIYIHKCCNREKANKTKVLSRYFEKSKNECFNKKIITCTIGIEEFFSYNE